MTEIRELKHDEYGRAMELALEVFLEFDSADYDEYGAEKFRETVKDQEYLDCLKVYGAFEAGELAGIISTRENGTHIAQFYVSGRFQNRGIGRQLFEHAAADNRKGFFTVASSSCGLEVYRKLGFVPISDMRKSEGLTSTPMERIELGYRERGSGKPLILLHGNGEDGTYFANQLETLAEEHRVIAVDTRGHGTSPRGTAPFTITRFAEDLNSFMLMKGIEKADILGFSDGGNVALKFAIMFPDRVDVLIADGANLYPAGVKKTVQIPVELAYFGARALGLKRKAEVLGLMVNDPFISLEELSAIRARTMIIAGTRDMIKREHTEVIAGSIPGAKLVFIDGDHFVARKKPRIFNEEVKKFLQAEKRR